MYLLATLLALVFESGSNVAGQTVDLKEGDKIVLHLGKEAHNELRRLSGREESEFGVHLLLTIDKQNEAGRFEVHEVIRYRTRLQGEVLITLDIEIRPEELVGFSAPKGNCDWRNMVLGTAEDAFRPSDCEVSGYVLELENWKQARIQRWDLKEEASHKSFGEPTK